MESTSIFSKSPQPHECDPNRSPTFGHHPEEPSQAKIASPKLPPEAPRETKVETIKSPGRKLSELLREREQEWTAVARKTGPLRLLDLPLDLLTQILREVTHNNDLASLALTCSAMHSVVTPLIYNRFDIVWPDASSSSEARNGVDALTYGLATLVMREDLFENVMLPRDDPKHASCHNYSCTQCGMVNHIAKADQTTKPRRLRRGNYFSQFTKKFSLGNGPADWVQEYLVTKESGKMLGTLVALSLARMPNLESFVWDMPTGILRDIWVSLSSLGDYDAPRLSKAWVRFHDNRTALQDAGLHYPLPTQGHNVMLPHSTVPLASMPSYDKLEFSGHPTENPNFSTLPPLRSLTVLAIDELAYLEEIGVLIGRSQDKLRELRIGLASKINTSGYDAYHPTVQLFAAGTEMALLFNALFDAFDPRSENYFYKPKPTITETPPTKGPDQIEAGPVMTVPQSAMHSQIVVSEPATEETIGDSKMGSDGTFGLSNTLSRSSFSPEIPLNYSSIDPALPHVPASIICETTTPETDEHVSALDLQPSADAILPLILQNEGTPPICRENGKSPVLESTIPIRQRTDLDAESRKLRLENLELERCILNVIVLAQSIEFSILTSLTLLRCEATDLLWTELSRRYPSPTLKQKPPVVTVHAQPSSSPTVQKPLRRISTMNSLPKEPKYQLNLKRLHTDTVASSLITFLSKSLAPNSLEWLFLQDNPSSVSSVTIDAIYRGPLRRHRASLTKVMMDSSTGASGSGSRVTSALNWMFSRDLLTFITSGKMSKLRELAMVVEYKDWHFFLQRLPNIPHLRSLYVPYIVNHVYGNRLNIRELAMGVVDVVTLRPEVELCYLGISTKCFEILERNHKPKRKTSTASNSAASESTDDGSGDDDYHASEADDEGNGDGGAPTPVASSSPPAVPGNGAIDQDADDDANDDDDNDGDGGGMTSSEDEEEIPLAKKLKYKLREILFYDDKISVFKARHGHL